MKKNKNEYEKRIDNLSFFGRVLSKIFSTFSFDVFIAGWSTGWRSAIDCYGICEDGLTEKQSVFSCSEIGEDSCSTFPKSLRGIHEPTWINGKPVDDPSSVLPEGIPFPDHGWNWLPVCSSQEAQK